MASLNGKANARAALLKSVLPESSHLDAVITHVLSPNNSEPSDAVPKELLQQAQLANSVAEISDGNNFFIKRVLEDSHVQNLRDVALRYDPAVLQSISRDANTPPAQRSAGHTPGSSQVSSPRLIEQEVTQNAMDSRKIQTRLFHAEPSAVIQRMISDNLFDIPSESKSGIVTFLENQPAFNIRKSSVVNALQKPEALKGVSAEAQPGVIEDLKRLQRVQSLASDPEILPPLVKNGIQSAFQVAQTPKSQFVHQFEGLIGRDAADQVHSHATFTAARNEQALLQIHQAVKGSGIAAIDGTHDLETRMSLFKRVAGRNKVNINLESLFGSLDYCECDDCTTVYSPANYLVDLLQFLRNNNLDPTKNPDGTLKWPVSTTLDDTVLGVLLKRRPDLQHLLLTCENTNTLIPYVDLANEVMESFVVHLDEYPTTWTADAQSQIDVFNVDDETSNELLAEPQHTNHKAYCILSQAICPLNSLPFHQPIEAIRIYLSYLKTSRTEILDIFRKPFVAPTTAPRLDSCAVGTLRLLHDLVINRAVTAEFLNMIHEEYVIITKESFWPKAYFDATRHSGPLSLEEYHRSIGVREIRESWGYQTDSDLLSDDKLTKTGLMWVKAQFMKRARMDYTDVVDLVKTRFVNPVYPSGKDRLIMQSISYSYRFLQLLKNLIPANAPNRKQKYAALVAFLVALQPWLEAYFQGTLEAGKIDLCNKISVADVYSFVYRWFDCIGKIVVLESGEYPTLPVYGRLVSSKRASSSTVMQPSLAFLSTEGESQSNFITHGTLFNDGTITDSKDAPLDGNVSGTVLGHVAVDSKLYKLDGSLMFDGNTDGTQYGIVRDVETSDGTFPVVVGLINKESVLMTSGRGDRRIEPVKWNPVVDTCNIESVRIQHLDGTSLSLHEWDRIQQFVRLWKRLGCTIDELDHAIAGWHASNATAPQDPDDSSVAEPDSLVELDDLAVQDCRGAGSAGGTCNYAGDSCTCGDEKIPDCACEGLESVELTPGFLDHYVDMKKIQDLLSIDLLQLLSYWDDISTSGDKSFYSRLFLTHNLVGIDPVFKADENENFLISSTKIKQHIPVIMAALRIKQDDLQKILQHTNLSDSDLTLASVSKLYRYTSLAKALSLKPTLIVDAISILGEPFENASHTLDFIKRYQKFDAGAFTIPQLRYVVLDIDDPVKPLKPKPATILKSTKTILDGLTNIEGSHPDLTDIAIATISAETVTQKTSLILSRQVCDGINALLQGTSIYTMAVPSGLKITVPESLRSKVSYVDADGTPSPSRLGKLVVTGILTSEESAQAKALSANSAWGTAIERAYKKALSFFKTNIAFIFSDQDEAIQKLLAGDVKPHPIPPPEPSPTETSGEPVAPQMDPGSTPRKQEFFMEKFLPYLRDQLSDQLIIDTMAAVSGISSKEAVRALLTSMLKVRIEGNNISSDLSPLQLLRDLKNSFRQGAASWTGYLIPPTTDTYTLCGFGLTKPKSIVIDGQPLEFVEELEDPEGAWLSSPMHLTGGRLYLLNSQDQVVPGLQWKTKGSELSVIPSSALLPELSSDSATKVFIKLSKAAIVLNALALSDDEMLYFQSHGSDFGTFNLDNISMESLERILDYSSLKSKLAQVSTSLLDLFKWASSFTDGMSSTPAEIATKVADVTSWPAADVKTLISPECFGLTDVKLYANEIALLKLKTALDVVQKVSVDIPTLFKWSNPLAKFWPTHAVAENMRKLIRSRYDLDEWEKIAAPLHNDLRMKQRDALVAYLLIQKQLIEWGVVDSDSLFEFFLIDVQMGACLKTSRMKQAISTVQTFVQRCFLGLETGKIDASGVPRISPETLDRERWKWMQKQTLWAANMKVLVNPESYLVASLRDDKSPLYQDLEGELKQKDINPQSVQESVKNYISEVDKVSNLMCEGIYEDENDGKRIYVMARTRSSPYLRFWRTYSPVSSEGGWTPWQTLPVDIQTYHVEPVYSNKELKTGQYDGAYVLPVVFQRRVILFFAQITPYSIAPDSLANQQLGTGTPAVSDIERLQSWKIQLGWSELRGEKWLQKQLTTDFLMETPEKPTPPPIEQYMFLSAIGFSNDTGDYIQIAVLNKDKECFGGFQYQGSQAFVIDKAAVSKAALIPLTNNKLVWEPTTKFHLTDNIAKTSTEEEVPPRMHSMQCSGGSFSPTSRPFVQYPVGAKATSEININGDIFPFYHEFSHRLLTSVNGFPNLDKLFNTFGEQSDTVKSTGFGEVNVVSSGTMSYRTYDELSTAYSLYNWEIGFHAPMQLAENLLQSQQFDAALDICHYVFDPYAAGDSAKRVWKWIPFTNADTENVIMTLFNRLAPNTPDNNSEVTAWRKNPYAPHVIARKRQVAYMKWTVMLYLKILIAYGDYYFRQNSLEAVPLALQCYILASHIYGPKAQKIPKRGKKKAQSYHSLLNKWNAISNAVVDMELQFPFSNQTPLAWGSIGQEPVLANLFGFATTHYFDIPANPQLQALRDQIDDRLYKIRHCQDINGNSISLALWEPPIDPSILVAAVAQGLSLSDILSDINAPMPNYRFYYLLQKALEMSAELKSLTSSFMSIKEKRDAEALQLLRANQEHSVHTLVMEVKNTMLEESNASLDTLRTSRRSPTSRYSYYTKLAGISSVQFNEMDTDYSEFSIPIPAPTTGDLVMTSEESNDLEQSRQAKDTNKSAANKEVFAGTMFAFPRIGQSAEPWGIGANIHFGPANIAHAATAHARYLRIEGEEHSFNAANSSKKAQIVKQFQDRALQANMAGLELLNISKQMSSQRLKQKMAQQEITNQQKLIDNANETLEMLKNKYTNDQLYEWLEGSVKTLMYETYKLAYDLAKKAETAYLFERGPQANPFIKFGYWDAGHDGLQCGEKLYVSLKQLEAAYQEQRGHDFEITKSISLRQINPGALVDLRETGTCQFEIPEILFDMDFPGHYFRRIKSVAVTMPCVVGPYTSINCTLRLLSHRYRVDPIATDSKSYVERAEGEGDSRFSTVRVPIDSIAVSSGQNDGGVFDFALNSERYLPFEGAGAISRWQLDLPPSFRQFDYDTITDVICTLRYTSRNGGDKLKKPAMDTVTSFISTIEELSDDQGLFAFFDLKAEYASEFARASSPALPTTSGPADPTQPRSITMRDLNERLPIFTRGKDPKKIRAKSVELLTATELSPASYSIVTDPSGNEDPVTVGNPESVGKLKKFSNKEVDAAMGTWRLEIGGNRAVALEKIYLVVRYVLVK